MDQKHDHFHRPEKRRSWWLSRSGIVAIVFLGFVLYYLVTEHAAHSLQFLPWLILLLCLFMHKFMHGGHGHGSGEDGDK